VIRRTTPQLPESSAAGDPIERLSYSREHGQSWPFTLRALKHICGRVNRKQKNNPQKLQEKMERVVLEGNNARETLHKKTAECTNIFWEVSDWMGIIS
jgi:hypothetical protein